MFWRALGGNVILIRGGIFGVDGSFGGGVTVDVGGVGIAGSFDAGGGVDGVFGAVDVDAGSFGLGGVKVVTLVLGFLEDLQ